MNQTTGSWKRTMLEAAERQRRADQGEAVPLYGDPSDEDLAAARLVLGMTTDPLTAMVSGDSYAKTPPPQRNPLPGLRSWQIIGSSGHVYDVEGTYIFCPCPAWKFSGQNCKHVRETRAVGMSVRP